MVASPHASKEDSYYQAYAQLQAALASPSATFDGPTVRAAAVAAFHAEQRRRSSTSRAPDSVMAFAASTGFRRPTTCTSTAAALITASCRMVRFVSFALSKPTSLLRPTATLSPTSPIKPSRHTKRTRLPSRIHTVLVLTSLA